MTELGQEVERRFMARTCPLCRWPERPFRCVAEVQSDEIGCAD